MVTLKLAVGGPNEIQKGNDLYYQISNQNYSIICSNVHKKILFTKNFYSQFSVLYIKYVIKKKSEVDLNVRNCFKAI